MTVTLGSLLGDLCQRGPCPAQLPPAHRALLLQNPAKSCKIQQKQVEFSSYSLVLLPWLGALPTRTRRVQVLWMGVAGLPPNPVINYYLIRAAASAHQIKALCLLPAHLCFPSVEQNLSGLALAAGG